MIVYSYLLVLQWFIVYYAEHQSSEVDLCFICKQEFCWSAGKYNAEWHQEVGASTLCLCKMPLQLSRLCFHTIKNRSPKGQQQISLFVSLTPLYSILFLSFLHYIANGKHIFLRFFLWFILQCLHIFCSLQDFWWVSLSISRSSPYFLRIFLLLNC